MVALFLSLKFGIYMIDDYVGFCVYKYYLVKCSFQLLVF